MQPLERGYYPNDPETVERLVRDLMAAMNCSEKKARQAVAESRDCEVWLNDVYEVVVRRNGYVAHLSIKRRDRQPVTDWRDKQAIKNQLVGPECEGVELFPAESRLVDTANQYHMWVYEDPKLMIPLGFYDGRAVTCDSDVKVGNSKQRKL